MPSLTFPVVAEGLVVPVLIGLDGATMAALRSSGRPIPAPVQARGALDTGADVTAVASWVMQQLAILPATTASTHTAAGPAVVNLYEVSLSITAQGQPGSPMWTHPALLVSELTALVPGIDVLVGLDVLLTGQLLLDGPARQFSVDF